MKSTIFNFIYIRKYIRGIKILDDIFIENNNIPFDSYLKSKVEKYSKDNGFDTINSPSSVKNNSNPFRTGTISV